jgi:hypothetical protein
VVGETVVVDVRWVDRREGSALFGCLDLPQALHSRVGDVRFFRWDVDRVGRSAAQPNVESSRSLVIA